MQRGASNMASSPHEHTLIIGNCNASFVSEPFHVRLNMVTMRTSSVSSLRIIICKVVIYKSLSCSYLSNDRRSRTDNHTPVCFPHRHLHPVSYCHLSSEQRKETVCKGTRGMKGQWAKSKVNAKALEKTSSR